MKRIILGVLMLMNVHESHSQETEQIVVAKCEVGTSAGWPIRFVYSDTKKKHVYKRLELEIRQEDPNNFMALSYKGYDIWRESTFSLVGNEKLPNVMPAEGLKAGNFTLAAANMFERRSARVGLNSEEISGFLEVKGYPGRVKHFKAKLTTVSKSGDTAYAELTCTNLLN